ncbi:MAG: hypothetical protein ACOYI7_08610 [Candidatus Excrementavichristensenella sp.]
MMKGDTTMKGDLKRILTLALLAALLAAFALPLPGLPPAAWADGDFVIVNGELTEYNGPGGVVRIPHGSRRSGRGYLKTVTILPASSSRRPSRRSGIVPSWAAPASLPPPSRTRSR